MYEFIYENELKTEARSLKELIAELEEALNYFETFKEFDIDVYFDSGTNCIIFSTDNKNIAETLNFKKVEDVPD